jgi:molecular chaperone GrpE
MQEQETTTPTEMNEAAEMPATEANAEVEALRQQVEEAKNKYLYLFSDFENFKRNAARERIDLMQTAGREVLTALIPVVDDFDRAAKNGALSDGTQLIVQKFITTLKSKGLVQVETQIGDAFDADRHEAIAEIPAPTEELKGKIVDIVEPGYQLGDRIIRFTKVVTGR